MPRPSRIRIAALALLLSLVGTIGGCGFLASPAKSELEDELTLEADLALRILDSSDVANAIPSLASLAENAGRMDELAVRIQTLLLVARALDAEATLWPAERAVTLRSAARRQARAALLEAEDWHRFEPDAAEAALLVHDARTLDAGLAQAAPEVQERLLRLAVAEAEARKDFRRLAAWRISLARLHAETGRLAAAEATLDEARSGLARVLKSPGAHDPGGDTLRLGVMETAGDIAAFSGRWNDATAQYDQALPLARTLRRRGDLKRILLKLALASESAGDDERSAWYRRRAEGVAGTPVNEIVRDHIANMDAAQPENRDKP